MTRPAPETRAQPALGAAERLIRPVLICLLVAAGVTAYNIRYPNYDPDQHIFCTMLLKDKHPDLFQKDFFFSNPEHYRYYVPWYRTLSGWTSGDFSGERMLERYNLLLFPSTFFFVLGFFVLFRRITGHAAAGWAAALAAIVGRQCLSVNPFGIGLAQSMVAIKLFFAGVPWILYLPVRARFSRASSFAAFFLMGIISNIHPILGIGLAILFAFSLAGLRYSQHGGWADPLIGLGFFGLGLSPFAVHYLQFKPAVEVQPFTAREFWEAFPPIWGYLPISLKGIRNFLMDALPLICFSGLAVHRRRRELSNEMHRFFFLFGGASLLAPIGLSALLQAQSLLSDRPPVIGLEPMRMTTFIYIPLLVYSAYFLKDILEKKISTRRLPVAGLFVLCVSLLFAQKEFPMRRVVREMMLKSGIYSSERTEIWTKERRRRQDLMDLSNWVRQHTPTDALFFHPHYDFRFHAQRSIVVGWKDGSMLTRVGSGKVREWLERTKRVREALKSRDPARVAEAARLYGCDYVILRAGEGPDALGEEALFENQTYRVYAMARENGKS